jgi:hypothetical protein
MPMNNRLLVPRQTLHPEALAWRSAVIANGGSVSGTTMNAVSRFCRSIDAAGIRDRFLRLSLMAGDSLLASLVPLYRGPVFGGTAYGNATDTNNGPFVSGDYLLASGLQGDGVSKRLSCGTSIASNATAANAHCMAYGDSLEAGSGSFRTVMGGASASAAGILAIETRETTDTSWKSLIGSATSTVVATPQVTSGCIVASAVAATDLRSFHNGIQVGSTQTANRGSSALSAVDMPLFAYNNNGSYINPSAARLFGYSFGLGLTAAQALAFYDALSAFYTAIGRS